MIGDVEAFSLTRPSQTQWQPPVVEGKFLSEKRGKLWVKGVTYGTFRPAGGGNDYDPRVVEADFFLMKRNCINAVRTYTMPPRWMLDMAHQYGIRLFIGFPWEEHITFLDQKATGVSIRGRLKTELRKIANHPAVLCCAIGNEIPSTIVRWHGASKIQKFLYSLYETAKECDPRLPITYVNYPSTEYLSLPFLDLFSYNVFIESKKDFDSYLARLHNLAGDRPLFLTEIGLDSRRNGLERQGRLLRSQIYSAFRTGCAGVFVYAWTDEWFRGGQEIEDWDFGITTRDRHPKPALDLVRKQYSKVPFREAPDLPTISVVVCSYNGSKTIEQCLQGLMRVDYKNHEVIVIDDGSTDSTASIASKYPVRLIRTPNRGLSAARNRGMEEARGDIIAYIDDDAYPDSNWLHYLGVAFQQSEFDCIGGPNLPPVEDGFMAQCVAHAPGGPIHVLLSDVEAEHVPGCNLAIRKSAMMAIGGFDPQFRVAGDDVDLCWRLQHAGYKIGYHPGAFVWHHRRNSASAYFRQQRGYGKAEVLLAKKWPQKYNGAGHVSWAGRIYQNGFFSPGRIYSGIWGTAPFQSIYQRSSGTLSSLTRTPEWMLVIMILASLTLISLTWRPLTFVAIPFSAAVLIHGWNAIRSARSMIQTFRAPKTRRYRTLLVSLWLHSVQPFARFIGRWPLWRPSHKRFIFPFRRRISLWSEQWEEPSQRLASLIAISNDQGAIVSHGNAFDQWDLEAKGGAFGSARLLIGVEEHGQGKQMTRFRIDPHCEWIWVATISLFLMLSVAAGVQCAWVAAFFLSVFTFGLTFRLVMECGRAMSALVDGIRILEKGKRTQENDSAAVLITTAFAD
jgi:glycosyltransferase involved in cell wall biosynthesis